MARRFRVLVYPIAAALMIGAFSAPATGQQDEFWSLHGNALPKGSDAFLGTTNNMPLVVRVNNQRAFRVEPASSIDLGFMPNIIGGASANRAQPGVVGAFIGSGGGGGCEGAPGGPNTVTGNTGVIGGGISNQAGTMSVVGGGCNNRAGAPGVFGGTVAGGLGNIATQEAAVGGGNGNHALSNLSFIGGGFGNAASGPGATVGGGIENDASGPTATIGGGEGNSASGPNATVAGGGFGNTASGEGATVGGGGFGNTASGDFATVPGGGGNVAAGEYAFAAGRGAHADHDGAFVWAGGLTGDIHSTAPNQFIVRAQGHVFFEDDNTLDDQGGFINTATGAFLSTGGTWTNSSDRDLKEGFEAVDPQQVLEAVDSLPISTWSYLSEPAVRHIGPTGQDFMTAFGLGSDERHISTVDADGVSLAAIQGLNDVVDEQEARIVALEERISELEGGHGSGGGIDPSVWLSGGALVLAAVAVLRRRSRG